MITHMSQLGAKSPNWNLSAILLTLKDEARLALDFWRWGADNPVMLSAEVSTT